MAFSLSGANVTRTTTEVVRDSQTYEFSFDLDFTPAGEQTYVVSGSITSANGDTIRFDPPSIGTLVYDPGGSFTYTVRESEVQDATSTSFVATDGVDTSTVTMNFALCFAAGTLIATPAGERRVERLAIGDAVTTADGRAVPVRWIGITRAAPYRNPADRLAPVAIAPGALGAGVPHTPLVVTADHGIVVDGHVVNASVLVGAPGIVFLPWQAFPGGITYYHIETDAHEVVLANGAPAETYVDYVGRRAFDNHAEYLARYGAERTIAEMDRPRISARRQLPPPLAARFGLPAEPPLFGAGFEELAAA